MWSPSPWVTLPILRHQESRRWLRLLRSPAIARYDSTCKDCTVLCYGCLRLLGCFRYSGRMVGREWRDGKCSRKCRREDNRTSRLRRESEHAVVGHTASDAAIASLCGEP